MTAMSDATGNAGSTQDGEKNWTNLTRQNARHGDAKRSVKHPSGKSGADKDGADNNRFVGPTIWTGNHTKAKGMTLNMQSSHVFPSMPWNTARGNTPTGWGQPVIKNPLNNAKRNRKDVNTWY